MDTLPAEFTASLGDVSLNVVDGSGIWWLCTQLDGWWGSSAGTLQVEQKTGDHGGWGGGSWLTPRALTLGVDLEAPDRSSLLAAVDRLSAAASLDDTTLRVVEPGFDRSCTVRRAGEPTAVTSGLTAEWSVPLIAEDPRRYGQPVGPLSTGLPSVSGGLTLPATPPWTVGATVVQGSVRCVNAGTIASRPVLRISGPVSQPQVLVTGTAGTSALTYYGDLLAGEWLDIDCGAHTVLIGGTVSRRGLVSGTWPQIPPGSAVDVGFRAAVYSAAASLAVTYRSAWM